MFLEWAVPYVGHVTNLECGASVSAEFVGVCMSVEKQSRDVWSVVKHC